MGEKTEYYCSNCGFEFVEEHLNFFYDDETKRIKEFIPLMSNYNMGEDSRINGLITTTYCPHCDKAIRIYKIYKYPEDIDKEEVLDIVNKGLRKNKKYLLIDFENQSDFSLDYQGEIFNCPNCNNEIKDIIILPNCPKCEEPIVPIICMMD